MANRDDEKLQVQAATDIVRLIGEQVSLRPKGKEFTGLCPFHDDKSPSMFVSPAKQIYKCFSCGAGGDAFSFVMNYHKMSFPEALKMLAERAGIELTPWQGGPKQEGPSERDRIKEANERALGFFRTLLKHAEHGKIARDYIEQRGISPQMVADFQLGVAPDMWDGLAQFVASKGYDRAGFEAAGLISPRKQGDGHYDRLRHRLIFPIFDAIGRPIAFGGRVMPGAVATAPKDGGSDGAKYLNSPETKLFNKSATLYGLHLAKKPIIDSRVAVVVEGHTDVIACHQAEQRNVVATLGTSLTREHVAELRRYCDQVVVIFDADEAGQKAADRAVEIFLTGDLDVAVANLPGGQDPADLLADPDGLERWRAAIDGAQDALAYQLERVKGQLDAAGTVTGRQKIAEAYIVKLAELGLMKTASLRRSFVIQRLCELLHMSDSQVQTLLRENAPRPRPTVAPAPPPVAPTHHLGDDGPEAAPHDVASPFRDDYDDDTAAVESGDGGATIKAIELAERQVIGALIRDNGLFHRQLADGQAFDEALVPEDFRVDTHRRLFKLLHERLAEGRSVTLASLLGDLAANHEQYLANTLTQAEADVERGSLGKAEKLCELFELAVLRLRAAQDDQAYRRGRDELLEKLAGPQNDVTVRAAALDEARQRLSQRPSPGRILRRK